MTDDWGGDRLLDALIAADPQGLPVYWLDRRRLRRQAETILQTLPRPFYAVKANSHPQVLQTLVECGIRCFDVASINELEQVRRLLPDAECAFMNPYKTTADIALAWQAGVRMLALDSMDELDRLLSAIPVPQQACLLVRVATGHGHAAYEMGGKFGAAADSASALLRRLVELQIPCGVTFHPGSQCQSPVAYEQAIALAAKVCAAADARIEVLDVGGGFPARYRQTHCDLAAFGQAIRQAVARHPVFSHSPRLQSEPGRSVVASAASVAVRVEARKDSLLILSDGKHGLLSELYWMPALHPVRRITRSNSTPADAPLHDFALAGPTCDSGDLFPGPYPLPADMQAGDWIEIGYLGAYALELTTCFNGYGRYRLLVQ